MYDTTWESGNARKWNEKRRRRLSRSCRKFAPEVNTWRLRRKVENGTEWGRITGGWIVRVEIGTEEKGYDKSPIWYEKGKTKNVDTDWQTIKFRQPNSNQIISEPLQIIVLSRLISIKTIEWIKNKLKFAKTSMEIISLKVKIYAKIAWAFT